MKPRVLRKAWAVVNQKGQIDAWPSLGGQLGLWETKPTKHEIPSAFRVVRVEIREVRR